MSKLKLKDENDQWLEVAANGAGIPSGGNAGDVLVKSSSMDYASEWTNPFAMKTFTPTLTSNAITFTNVVGLRQGNVVWISFDAKILSSLAQGGTASFTVANIPDLPSQYIRTRSISGSYTLEGFIGLATGTSCGLRNLGSAISANTLFYSINFMYITP